MAMALHQILTKITIIVANNLPKIFDQASKMTANTALDSIKQAICALWLELEKWHQSRSIDTNSTAIVETLKRITYASWHFLVNQTYLIWHARDEYIHHWFQGSSSYLKAEYLQQTWNEMNEEYKLTDTADDIFTQFQSAGENFFRYLIRAYHNDKIRHRVHVAARYLIAVLVLIICIRCFFVLLSCLGFILSSLFMFISSVVNACLHIVRTIFGVLFTRIISIVKDCFHSVRTIFRFLFSRIISIVKACLHFVRTIFRFLFTVIISIVKACFYSVPTIFWFLKQFLCFGGKSAVKMMKAPGRPSMMIARAVFEADPQGYFANLRGRL
ncbi:hypothetical protein L6452_18313 [Arctium lappa]|uniref:Uncharacterized protein n=1 Tax=Arctium lappa TaxID=4217 RepID=A0ACB9C5T8_ARCLA|nr:hypothetical protein L6452_18313 [Arctium lappa]